MTTTLFKCPYIENTCMFNTCVYVYIVLYCICCIYFVYGLCVCILTCMYCITCECTYVVYCIPCLYMHVLYIFYVWHVCMYLCVICACKCNDMCVYMYVYMFVYVCTCVLHMCVRSIYVHAWTCFIHVTTTKYTSSDAKTHHYWHYLYTIIVQHLLKTLNFAFTIFNNNNNILFISFFKIYVCMCQCMYVCLHVC